jgi:UMF1 family MFS transporter
MSLTTAVTGNARWSILGIIPLFVIGFVIFIILPREQKYSSEITG